ncbi:hypothetical protein FJR05_18945 [Dolichospermum sp. UHCC 0259]|nr:hypothetical protein [Dolichospermum sp. UHCC 0259]
MFKKGNREQARVLPITHYPLPITHYPLPITINYFPNLIVLPIAVRLSSNKASRPQRCTC